MGPETMTRSRRPTALAAALALASLLGCEPVPEGGPAAPVRAVTECEVTRIADGDSIDCAPLGRIRLVGIDTPELSQDPIGRVAADVLRSHIPIGSRVGVELDVEERDRNGRLLGYVWAEGRLVNWLMVRSGHAVTLTYPPNVQYVDALEAAQGAARSERSGLWAADGFDCLPIERRRGSC